MNLTICYTTARANPEIQWMAKSLAHQMWVDENIHIIVMDGYAKERGFTFSVHCNGTITLDRHIPKPNFWQGSHRLTKEDWWAKSNALNTFFCLAKTEWVVLIDDRCVLMPGWLQGIRDAVAGNYAVFGAYEKRTSMTVENGFIKHGGIVIGKDSREQYLKDNKIEPPFDCPGEWSFGCCLAFPLEWALKINGYCELCDGLGFEDIFFGMYLKANGFPIKYDYRVNMIEDRTPDHEAKAYIKHEDKGVSPNDKSHWILDKLKDLKTAPNRFDLRDMRQNVQSGKGFPLPTGSPVDEYDGQLLQDM